MSADSASFTITILGSPKAWKRADEGVDPKSGRRWKRTPEPMRTAQNEIKLAWERAGKPALKGAIDIDVIAFIQRPKSHYGTGRNAGKLKPSAPKYVTTIPDWDNYGKQVSDALNKLAWPDDKFIRRGTAGKEYADNGFPRLVLRAWELEGDA